MEELLIGILSSPAPSLLLECDLPSIFSALVLCGGHHVRAELRKSDNGVRAAVVFLAARENGENADKCPWGLES